MQTYIWRKEGFHFFFHYNTHVVLGNVEHIRGLLIRVVFLRPE